ncbi:hypothetical protein RhiirC2_97171 [Rhizophagus irregularis]|uniref:Uncharacterized protein n=1 Tax=Rhizophagus irregularis TaxID=588596 RepID=A0A2N1MSM1_9GLOM|nr:hypothetical protein RhiirC2_97171 [Rhizophagus irregularis]
MNFSYKKYRFHFGIFILCNHTIVDKHLPGFKSCCTVPSPIVMSQNRHGCGIHFHQKNQTILGFKVRKNTSFIW